MKKDNKSDDSTLSTSKLSGSALGLSRLSESTLSTSKLSGSALGLSRLSESTLSTSKLSGSALGLSRLSESELSTSKLSGSALGLSRLSESELSTSKLSGSVLGLSRLSESALSTSKLSGSALGLSRLSESALSTSKLSDSVLGLSRLSESALSTSKLSDSVLGLSRLSESALDKWNTDFSGIKALNVTFSKIPNSYSIEGITYKDSPISIISNGKESVPVDSLVSTLSPMDIISDLTTDEVFAFYNHLIKYPLLGLTHKVGKKIFNEISNQKLTNICNIRLFRARERDEEQRKMPFNELEMFEAPYGLAGHGRFNVNGQGELYTCENEKVALQEIGARRESSKKFEVIEWELIHEVKLLDLTNRDSELVKFCLFKKVSNNSQEYLVPNFLAQCAKFHGICGIKVSSTINSDYNNYIFFDYEKKWFVQKDLKFNIVPTF